MTQSPMRVGLIGCGGQQTFVRENRSVEVTKTLVHHAEIQQKIGQIPSILPYIV